MRTILPILVALAAILVACSGDAPDTMASMLRDAGEAVDAAMQDAADLVDALGPDDARAQPQDDASAPAPAGPEVLEAECELEQVRVSTTETSTRRFHVFAGIDYKRVREAWRCTNDPRPTPCADSIAVKSCSGFVLPAARCVTGVQVSETADGLMIECGAGYHSVRLVLDR